MTPPKPLLTSADLDSIVAAVLKAGGEPKNFTRDVAQSAAALGARKIVEALDKYQLGECVPGGTADFQSAYTAGFVAATEVMRKKMRAAIEADGEEPKL